ncbi:MAG TPA: hypothetical protein DCP38_16620 [Acidobacteria bacterium]|nr:hypothetical protein [Acidobacteriota bacterium]MDP6373333.1 PQQ-dependent sugar dehydrogenase [Vicinamibacterales bacterium]HAK57083.1 hypothetical protein [Acidobacteriota bacterium]
MTARSSTGRTLVGAAILCGMVLVAAGVLAAWQPQAPTTPRNRFEAAAALFERECAACHGSDSSGGRAVSLFDQAWLDSTDDDAIVTAIENGVPDTEMAPYRDLLEAPDVWALVQFIRTRAGSFVEAPAYVARADGEVVDSERHTFRVDTVVGGLETPWALVFLPDGRMLVTERRGTLRIVANNELSEPVTGTPEVWERQDAGMHDVEIHPEYADNGWIYLAYSEVAPGHTPSASEATPGSPPGREPPSPPNMQVFIRGRIDDDNRWVDQELIYRASLDLYTSSDTHYGTRLVFDDANHLFFAIGERGVMEHAQDLSSPLGKIHRVNDDGSIPDDNPFVGEGAAVPSIWSYGHRNPEGLAWHPETGALWESEHGPRGGDEINLIEPGHNYGWGVISSGIQRGITEAARDGMESPIVYYTPTLAPAGIAFYTGNPFSEWTNSLLVGSLWGQELRRLEIVGREVTHQEVLFAQFGRVRDVVVGPDGYVYVARQDPTGGSTGVSLTASTPGSVIRLVPVED